MDDTRVQCRFWCKTFPLKRGKELRKKKERERMSGGEGEMGGWGKQKTAGGVERGHARHMCE